jgi:hypothetical protein
MPLQSAGFRLTGVGYANQVQSDGSGATVDQFGQDSASMSLGAGTAANQGDRASRDERTLTNAPYTYTLSAMPDGHGMARVRMFYLRITSAIASGGTLSIAPGATHPWPAVTLSGLLPGSVVLLTWPDTAGAPAVSGASDQFTVTATGTVAYTLAVVGCSV